MNPANLFTLTDEQKERYYIQPDNLPDFFLNKKGNCELPQHLPGTSLRFWLNNQYTDFDAHWHTATELIVPLEGNYTAFINTYKYNLDPGDIFVIPSGTVHSLKASQPGWRFIFCFEIDFLSKIPSFSNLSGYLNSPILISQNAFPAIYRQCISLIMQMAEYYWSLRPCMELHVNACLLSLFACYGDYMINQGGLASVEPAAREALSLRMNIALRYIDNHYTENLSLKDAAEQAGFSKYHFSRLFKEYTGQTFSDYLRNIRIRAAQSMLLIPDMKVSTIAQDCGFSSLSAFNKSFLAITGCTPTKYRLLYSFTSHKP